MAAHRLQGSSRSSTCEPGFLLSRQEGEAAALYHPKIGDIDLVWGEVGPKGKGYGLAKIAQRHPEVLSDLGGILERLPITQRQGNNIVHKMQPTKPLLPRKEWPAENLAADCL